MRLFGKIRKNLNEVNEESYKVSFSTKGPSTDPFPPPANNYFLYILANNEFINCGAN